MSDSNAFQQIQIKPSQLNSFELQYAAMLVTTLVRLVKDRDFSVTVSSVSFKISNETQLSPSIPDSTSTESRPSSVNIRHSIRMEA